MTFGKFYFYSLLLICFACGLPEKENEQNTNTKTKEKPVKGRILVSPQELTPCIKKELKLNTKYDVASYENLGVKYFHKVMDYPTEKSRELDDELKEWMRARDKLIVRTNGELAYKDSVDYQKAIQYDRRIDSLKQELRKYRKEVSGYVFVHTFRSGSDTISAIFLMDKFCIYSEAIEVRTVPPNIDPEDYKMFIRE